MTSPEEQELLAKIGQLAGKINLHKAQQAGVHSIPSSHTSYHRHSTFRPGGHGHRHRVGPYPARGPTGYRNRSLVLGNGGTQTPPSESSTPESTGPTSSSTWISKNTPGQRSLINSAVYKENSEATSKAIEATRQQRLVKQNAREKSQLVNHFQRYNGRPSAPGTPTNPAAVGQHEVEIEGIRYRVAHNGSKLIKISGDLHPANATPKVAFVGGVKFHRSKTGNLYRAGVLKAHRQNGIKKVDMPCSMFSLTGALVCRSFGLYGYCDKGDECEERHVFECPDFSNTGKCKNRSCKLLHRERASVLRKRAEGDEMEDLSSDEEEADSDDVDSDEVEEFVNDAVGDDSDFKVQKDFIAF
ncbi:Zinc finger CCCH domain-containing protein 7 [Colletotrichum sidae]|uniref:Zinc finger CCCH domain-containing protein 7 n=1 Tax=Colletotrichum sidae TaxID=1347389 RepID=A0A4R8TL33_9PEZI|nr:Zinc finger CCCH domain-containing protein 7 [Colletotrichum sidae]